jgi:phage shock protein C
MAAQKKLIRSRSDKMIAGVFGGLGNYLNIDPTILRLIYVFITIFSGVFPGLIAYIIAAIIIPQD